MAKFLEKIVWTGSTGLLRLSCATALLVAYSWAATSTIGVASGPGTFSLDGAKVEGNANVFEGSQIKTGGAPSRVYLETGELLTLGINSSGIVVGTATDAQGTPRAFIWENGVMRDLGVAPGHITRALAINDRGQVMGSIDGGCTTFFWENGQTQIVGPICPAGLSPNGEVIGRGGGHAFLWQAGRLIDLGRGEPRAINGRSEVVGWSGCCSYTRPMLWRKKP